jgi:hypothetical protein
MFCSLSREGAKFSNNNSGEGWWTEYNYSSRSTAVLQLYQLYPGTSTDSTYVNLSGEVLNLEY